MDNVLTYCEPTEPMPFLGGDKKWINDAFKVKIEGENDSKLVTISITSNAIEDLFDQIKFHNHLNQKRDNYCVLAINNLIKKNEFLQLNLQFAENQITEDEYEQELETNTDRYIINLDNTLEPNDINVIGNILHSIGRKFNTDEVAEMFSIDIHTLNSNIKALQF